jgi:hypothetical protein
LPFLHCAQDTALKPHRQGTFKLPRDPEFATKVADIVGLYLDPPGGAVVPSVPARCSATAGPPTMARSSSPSRSCCGTGGLDRHRSVPVSEL